MKHSILALLVAAGTLLGAPRPVKAAPVHFSTDNPAEVQRKTAARMRVVEAKKATALKKSAHKSHKSAAKLRRAMLVLLGLEESKAVTSPAKRDRQLRMRQKHLKMSARHESWAHRARCIRQMK